jgi:N-acetylglucosamine kinase-like BadF-type ATPase
MRQCSISLREITQELPCENKIQRLPKEETSLNHQIVLGIDGGGTNTRVAVATTTGRVLGIGQSGPGNYHDVGIDSVKAHITEALANAWSLAGLPPQPAAAAFLGLASVASAEDRQTIRQMAREMDLARDDCIGVDHDLRIAMAGALVGGPGIVLIVGTGSSCYGRAQSGKTWRAGGWGPVLDDIGSGGWLGLQSMIAAVRDFDGRGAPTVLRAKVLEVLQLDDMQQILHRIDAEGLSRTQTAALARLVLEAARQNDEVAQEIIARGADELATMIATVERKLDLASQLGEIPVAVTGGLVSAGTVLLEPLRAAIGRRAPQCALVQPKLSPVLGGVLLAIEAWGQTATSDVIDNLQASQAGPVH